ncbi:MAG: hypothetical protein ACE5EQ_09430 [Phycisphaerae bacterium]
MDAFPLNPDHDPAGKVEEAPSAPPSFGRTLLAPLWIHQPAVAASRMVHGSRLAFWLSYGLGVLTLAGVILFLRLWNLTVDRVRLPNYQIRERSFAEAWELMHANQSFGDAELIVTVVCLLAVPVALLGAFLYLPIVHNGGSARHSFRRAFAAIASGIGILNLLVMSVGALFVFIDNLHDPGHASLWREWIVMGYMILILASASGLFYWLHLATRSVAGPKVDVELPPRCEGCGYDLTHRSSEGRCTECGLDLDASLTPDLRRPGCEWQRRGGANGWLASSLTLVVSPGYFYGRLKLRTPPDEDVWFARRHFVALGIFGAFFAGAMTFMIGIKVGSAPPTGVFCGIPLIALLLVPLVCWVVKRLVGAIVTSWCVVFDALPDASWMKRVIAYETAYLWVFCFYTMFLTATFVRFEDWMTRLLSPYLPRLFGGILPEVAVVLFGNVLIGLAWFWRYRIAIHRVRWSNY